MREVSIKQCVWHEVGEEEVGRKVSTALTIFPGENPELV